MFSRVCSFGCRVDFCSVRIENAKQVRLVVRRVRLHSLECFLGYKERPFHSAVMAPEPNCPSGRIKNAAWIWEIEHSGGSFQSILEILHFRRPSASRAHQ